MNALSRRGVYCLLLLALLVSFGQLKAQVTQQNLLLYLPFAEDLADHSPSQLTVTNVSHVRLADGAAYFDGQTNWLEVPNVPLNRKSFAISLWLKPTGQHPMYGLLEQKGADRVNRWLHIMLRGGRQPYLGFYINDAISPEDIPVNQWSYLVFQYRDGQQEIWVNGTFMCARKAKAYAGKGGVLRIGYSPRWNNVPSRDFQGYMRELRIYDTALTEAEIKAHYHPEGNYSQQLALAGFQPPSEPRITLATAGNETAAAENGLPFLSLSGNNLTITGESRQVYDILATEDLNKPWVHLMTVTNRWGTLKLVDDEAPKRGNTFYRIQVRSPKAE